MKIVDETENGSEVPLADGETLEVRLPESGGTGYQWSVVGLDSTVELLGDDFVLPELNQPGARGTHRFTFVAHGSSGGRVMLELRRSWEQSADPEDRFELRVRTAPAAASLFEDRADE